MSKTPYPALDPDALPPTRETLHGYARLLGDWLVACRPPQKHWWHVSLRPCLQGLTTGVVHAGIDFEITLDLVANRLCVDVAEGDSFDELLLGQTATELAETVEEFLLDEGLDPTLAAVARQREKASQIPFDFCDETAANMARILRSISGELSRFQAGIREETSPIQLWPHHFDLSMLWLPGELIPGQDPQDAENADKQMNFGFTFGDAGIPEPYFYITAYPFPANLSQLPLPQGTVWQSEGFTGAVLRYRELLKQADPGAYLQALWSQLLVAGRQQMLSGD